MIGRCVRAAFALPVLVALLGGLPYVLVAQVGWPLPRELPSADVLTAPISDQALLNALALALWLLWALFSLAVIREGIARIRGLEARRMPVLGRLAASLVGALSFALVPVHGVQPLSMALAADNSESHHRVKPGETLWQIAATRLDEAQRWRDIWRLNKHRRQADGTVFRHPGRIRPGWRLRLPAELPAQKLPNEERPEVPPPRPEPETPVPEPSLPPAEPLPPIPPQSTPSPQSTTSISLPSGAIVGLSFAAGVSAALVTARIHRRRAGRPAPVAGPAVRRMRSAVLEVAPSAESRIRPYAKVTIASAPVTWSTPIHTPEKLPVEEVPAAVTSAGEVTLSLAAVAGLGLVGPGAEQAARSLVLTLLAMRGRREEAEVVMPEAVAVRLFGAEPKRPPGLVIRPSLAEALARVEVDLLLRARDPSDHLPLVVLVANPDDALAPVLDEGRELRVCGLILGAWPGSCSVAADGVVTDVGTEALVHLRGTRLFGLTPADSAEVLDVLTAAEGPAVAPPPRSSPSIRPVFVQVLGDVAIGAVAEDVRPKRRDTMELVAYLAANDDGVSAERLTADLGDAWSGALDGLRGCLRPALGGIAGRVVAAENSTYRLDPELVDVDLWRFRDAVERGAFDEAAGLYRGEFAGGRFAWADALRDDLRRSASAVLSQIADHADADNPERALAVLEQAKEIDEYDEALFQRIMRLQVRLGRRDAVRATYALLEARLSVIGAEPAEESRQIVGRPY